MVRGTLCTGLLRSVKKYPQLLRHHKHKDLLTRIVCEIDRRPEGEKTAINCLRTIRKLGAACGAWDERL